MKPEDMLENLKRGITLYRIVRKDGKLTTFEIVSTEKNINELKKMLNCDNTTPSLIWDCLGKARE